MVCWFTSNSVRFYRIKFTHWGNPHIASSSNRSQSYYQINSYAHISKSKSRSHLIFVLWTQCNCQCHCSAGAEAQNWVESWEADLSPQHCLSFGRLQCIIEILFSTSQDKHVLFITSSNATIHSSPLDKSHESYRKNVT